MASPIVPVHAPSGKRALLLVFGCTILGAAAQILMKSGANAMVEPGFLGVVLTIMHSLPLFAGYCLYGMSTVLLVLALKEGELSMLYPIIALTYVWVTVLSFVVFHDRVNAFKIAGIAIIVTGVAVLGKGSPRK